MTSPIVRFPHATFISHQNWQAVLDDSFRGNTMHPARAISCGPRTMECPDTLSDRDRSAIDVAGESKGGAASIVAGGHLHRGRRRWISQMRGAVTAVALVLLVESLIGNTWTVLGSGLILGRRRGQADRSSGLARGVRRGPVREHVPAPRRRAPGGVCFGHVGLAPPLVPGGAADQLASGRVLRRARLSRLLAPTRSGRPRRSLRPSRGPHSS